jgi:hypothetical protein
MWAGSQLRHLFFRGRIHRGDVHIELFLLRIVKEFKPHLGAFLRRQHKALAQTQLPPLLQASKQTAALVGRYAAGSCLHKKNGGYWFLDQGGATPVMRA